MGKSIWRHNPCLLQAPIVGEKQSDCLTPLWVPVVAFCVATSPLPSRVPIVGINQYGDITLDFSGSLSSGETNTGA